MLDGRALRAVARHPSLWPEAVRAMGALAPDGWWRRPHRIALEPRYLAWRTQTAYGSSDASIEPVDLIAYLRWRKGQRR